MNKIKIIIFIIVFSVSFLGGQTSHPNLILKSSDVIEIKNSLDNVPLFDKSFEEAKTIVAKAIKV